MVSPSETPTLRRRNERGAVMRQPSGLLVWRPLGASHRAAGYSVHATAPHRWEVTLWGDLVDTSETRTLAMARAETHYRERLRTRDLRFHGAVALLGLVLLPASYKLVPKAELWMFVVQAVIAFTALLSLMRFIAAMTRTRENPYRRPDPWERRSWSLFRRRWERTLGESHLPPRRLGT